MLEIRLNKLTVPGAQALAELRPIYEALRLAAIRENDLRAYVEADLTLASMEHSDYALMQPESYFKPAYYLKAEPSDRTEDLIQVRLSFGYYPAVG